MQYIIGVDMGTSGTKAIALDTGGKVLEAAYQSYPLFTSFPGAHELEPSLLLDAVLQTIRAVTQKMDPASGLMAISFSSAMHSLMAVDGLGNPLTRIITWADLRSRDEAANLKSTEAGRRIYQNTGTPVHPMSPLCKILWLKKEQPEIFSLTGKFISVKEFIWFRLFGKYMVDFSLASGTGLFDIRRLHWDKEALEVAGITENHLSDPVPPTHMEKMTGNSLAGRLGVPEGLPFVIGGSDGCLANLGTSAISHHDMALTIGTSGAVRMISPTPVEDPEARIFNYILTENLYVTGGAINNGALVVKWFAEQFMEPNSGHPGNLMKYLDEIRDLPAGSDGLIFLPYLYGERSPVWDADARAVFFGIQSSHGPRQFLRAVVEGISFSLYQISLILREKIGPAEKIYASGGFIQSSPWLQTVSDIFNQELYLTSDVDASSIGAAIMGFYALGIIRSLDESKKMISVQDAYRPVQREHGMYMKNYSLFAILYEKLKPAFEQISHL